MLKLIPNYKNSLLKLIDNRFTIFFITYLIIYSFISFIFITKYPVIHIDEAWLSSFVDNFYKTGNWNSGSSAFVERQVHFGLYGNLFLFLQLISHNIFGYSLFAARFLSFAAFLGSIVLLARFLLKLNVAKSLVFLSIILFSTSRTLIYMSHHGRQESLVLLFFITALNIAIQAKSFKDYFILGIVTGIAAEIHITSLFITGSVLVILLYEYVSLKKHSIKKISFWFFVNSLFYLSWFLVRYFIDSKFIDDYFGYAQSSSGFSPVSRSIGFYNYIIEIYVKRSFTKTIPELAILTAFILTLIVYIKEKTKSAHYNKHILIITASVIIGIFILGRFNIYYAALFLGWMSIFSVYLFKSDNFFIIPIGVIAINAGISLALFSYHCNTSFDNFIITIKNAIIIKKTDTIIGTIGYQYGFSRNRYIAFRDLKHFLKQTDLSEEDAVKFYFSRNKINYVLIDSYLRKHHTETVTLFEKIYQNSSISRIKKIKLYNITSSLDIYHIDY
jgi:hypothetical protein